MAHMFNLRILVPSIRCLGVCLMLGAMAQQADAQTNEATRWIDQLKGGSTAEKIEAADRIADAGLPAEETAAALLAGLNDPEAGVRWRSARRSLD